MKLLSTVLALTIAGTQLSAQSIDEIVTPAAVQKSEETLASDAMRGRATFTPDIDRAADYIESRFKAAGLNTWNGSNSYRQPFTMLKVSSFSATTTIDGQHQPPGHVFAVTASTDLTVDENSGYEKVWIKPGATFSTEIMHYIRGKKNYVVLVDTSFTTSFPRLARFGRQQFKSDNSVIFILTASDPAHFSVHIQQEVTESKLANVVGILPGKSRKNEIVIFSGHYDHLGVGKPDNKGDSIFNGANDDASGTTAVMMLADYFAKKKNNERTIVFVAFTAEEIGGYGSQYFSNQFDPATVMAMFNIEMIGSASKWGANSAFITGFERSDMGKILQKDLTGSTFTFYPDPYPEQQLFYRSDNATLARQGVPAHTISTTQIDKDPYYHHQSDEISTIDIDNMVRIIKAIALSSTSIIDGKDTPTRVDTTQLR